MLGQGNDSRIASVKGRNFNPQQIKSMEKIFAKLPLPDQSPQILIGCCDDPGIHFNFLVSANSANPAIFDSQKELGLSGRRKAYDFIKK